MAIPANAPSGRECFFEEDEIIVSKTDLKGIITYSNRVFQRVAGYEEEELLGMNHNCIRHPEMPRCVFQLLWDVLRSGHEIFAYVVNQARNGDHYWVYAHVTPTLDARGRVIGYHSNRRMPDRAAVAAIEPIYAELLEIEGGFKNRKEGIQASTAALLAKLSDAGVTYDQFVWSLAA